jgi:hypothetical protein
VLEEVPHREVAHLNPARGELCSKRPQRDVGLLRQASQKPVTLAGQGIRPAAPNLVSRGASGRPEPLRPLHNARNADLELGRDRTTALPGRNRRNHTLAQIKRIGSGHQMLASIPASILNHIRNSPGIPPIQKKSAML